MYVGSYTNTTIFPVSTTLTIIIFFLGYQHIRMYDIASNNSNPVVNYDNISLNVTDVGFNSDGKWMYTGGEDRTVKIWDLRLET